jgi:ClpP class serine protease
MLDFPHLVQEETEGYSSRLPLFVIASSRGRYLKRAFFFFSPVEWQQQRGKKITPYKHKEKKGKAKITKIHIKKEIQEKQQQVKHRTDYNQTSKQTKKKTIAKKK